MSLVLLGKLGSLIVRGGRATVAVIKSNPILKLGIGAGAAAVAVGTGVGVGAAAAGTGIASGENAIAKGTQNLKEKGGAFGATIVIASVAVVGLIIAAFYFITKAGKTGKAKA